MRVDWLQPTDTQWSMYVGEWQSDVYHLPAYATASSDTHALIQAVLISHGQRQLLVPLVINEIAGASGLIDASSPYGYPGPIISPMGEEERYVFLQESLPALVEGLSDAGIVSTFVRLHPFVGLRPEEVGECGTIVHHGDTVLIDLTQREEELWSQTRKGHRYEINRSRKRGHRAFQDAAWDHFEDFLDIYAETMSRVAATENYTLSRDYFQGLRDGLGASLHLWVVEIEGDIAAASLFTEFNGIVQYHLSGTKTDYLSVQPNKLLLNEVRSWAKERGNRMMHLGGGVGGAHDSLFSFKAGFSKLTCPFYTWRLVTNPEAYVDLIQRRGFDPAQEDSSGFFPPYRRPLP